GVSILVLVDRPHRLRHHALGERPVWVFQSLFSWIALTDTSAPGSPPRRAPGFTPCSRGSPSPTTPRRPCPPACPEFQSLFCSLARPAAHHLLTCRTSCPWFLSLFSWIALTPRPRVRRRALGAGCVSILVLVDRPHRRPDGSTFPCPFT